MKLKLTPRRVGIIVVSLVFLGFQGYIAFVKPLPPLLQNPIHLVLALLVGILHYPVYKHPEGQESKTWKDYLFVIDIVACGILMFIGWYFLSQADRLMNRIQYLDPLTTLDYVVMVLLVVLLLEAVRRVLGLNLLIFIAIFLVYSWFGKYFPGIFAHRGTNLKQFTDLMVMGADGIFGSPLNSSAGFLYYFVLFGAFFAACGGGQVLIDLGMKLSAKGTGGPAKAAVISSGLFGMVNGSAVANVSTTGVMTIPLMKSVGYRPEQAGAVEAVASTGGQLMPPIMGVGAFIMAEMIGVPYSRIATAAIIPAIAYYAAVFILVDSLARKNRVHGLNAAEVTKTEPILPRLYMLLPVVIVLYFIMTGTSLMYSAIYGIVAVLVINLLRGKKGLSPAKMFENLLNGTKQVAEIAIPTGACGIIIGIVVMSGLATKLSTVISSIGQSHLWVALMIAMLGCMILGMALPTVAAYLAAYILFIPSLLKLGIPALPANMFIFYFGIIAQITPPVCLASFTAAGIAKADAWKTGWTAFSYALAGFLVPYVFVYQPELLLMGTALEIAKAAVILFAGTYLLASAISGFLVTPMNNMIERGLTLLAAILVIIPEGYSDMVGFALAAVIILRRLLLWRKSRHRQSDATP